MYCFLIRENSKSARKPLKKSSDLGRRRELGFHTAFIRPEANRSLRRPRPGQHCRAGGWGGQGSPPEELSLHWSPMLNFRPPGAPLRWEGHSMRGSSCSPHSRAKGTGRSHLEMRADPRNVPRGSQAGPSESSPGSAAGGICSLRQVQGNPTPVQPLE